jgi:hypothetical protein
VLDAWTYGLFKDDDAPSAPNGLRFLCWLIVDFYIEPTTVDLSGIDIHVLKIVKGEVPTPNEIHV